MMFDTPLLLLLAPVLGLALGFAAWLGRRRRIRLARRWSPALGRLARSRGMWAPLVLGLVGLASVVALAGPRWGRTQIRTESRALSLVFAVDISRSMLAEDAAPNRLQRAVREARRLIQDLEGDRLGLIAFAGRSYILSPLTVDGGAIRMYLDALDPDLASEGGTNLSSVLAQGTQLLGATTDAADRVLVLFTDGEAHDTLTDVVRQAEALKEAGVHLIVVAEGGASPARIPVRDSAGALVEYKRDDEGTVIQTQRRDDVLHAVVEAAEGTLVPAETADQGGAVRDLVAAMKRSPTSATRTADLVPRAWIPALAAALLLLGYTLARPGPALIGLAGVLLLARPAEAQRPSAGGRALAAGDPARAAAEFLKEASAGRARDTAFYNAGTAALEAGRLDVARGALAQATKSLDPALRYRALYNLGLAGLLAARADTSRQEEMLEDAIDRLRQALLLQPASARAKWNLELAERRRPPPPPSGGGGGAPPPPSGGAQSPEQRPEQPGQKALSQSQAEQILNSMERRERMTREEQQRRMESSSGGVKDW
ncbi:MAG TPA: VWA domain-containing protein [Gemmatimonadales bacterium]|jgi:Ca-activated chloride channel family protein|nr:VWA domain-containing protein [Gemmatimonadales bacterium]